MDLKNVAPAALVRLLNSTPLGEVITERRLYRHRQLAGLRIGSDKGIHLAAYGRWLAARLAQQDREAPAVAEAPNNAALQYEQHRKRAAARQATIAEAGQEIGPPPPVKDPKRREQCRRDFGLFALTYFKAVFYLGFSDDHLRAIKKIEQAVLEGRLFAFAMPRGSGKTSLSLVAVIWAALYGQHRFICLIAATERRSRKLLEKIYNALERNELLMADFPEVCWPIRKLERTPQRAAKQKCQGQYTSMLWTKNEIVLPTMGGSDASGAIITVCGLTGGEVRGQVKDMPDGSMARPSLVLLDDPQTKASARSRTQTDERLELLSGDVLGMAGPDKNIAGMMPCTVIHPDDMADQILNPELHPDWHGERTKMVYHWPANEKLWEEYARLRANGLRGGDGGDRATQFYIKNRRAMDAGSEVAWAERFPPDAVSAIQHAMNLRLRDEPAFFAEYQNEPIDPNSSVEILSPAAIADKVNGYERLKVPSDCQIITMYQDVHDSLIWFAVVGWTPAFSGYVLDYGAYPDQGRRNFTMRQATRTMRRAHPGKGREGAILMGLGQVSKDHLATDLVREDGAAMRVNLCMVDSGYEADTVYTFVRMFASPALLPSKGLYLGARSTPWEQRHPKTGEHQGHHWRIVPLVGKARGRLVLIDTNYWKSFLHKRLAVPMGEAGCLSLYGKRRSDGKSASASLHQMLADHLTSETKVTTEGHDRQVDEWRAGPSHPDNHLLDCLVGCAVGASMLGLSVVNPVTAAPPAKKTKKKKPTVRQATYL